MNNKLLNSCLNNESIQLSDQGVRNLKKFQRNNKNFADLLSSLIDLKPSNSNPNSQNQSSQSPNNPSNSQKKQQIPTQKTTENKTNIDQFLKNQEKSSKIEKKDTEILQKTLKNLQKLKKIKQNQLKNLENSLKNTQNHHSHSPKTPQNNNTTAENNLIFLQKKQEFLKKLENQYMSCLDFSKTQNIKIPLDSFQLYKTKEKDLWAQIFDLFQLAENDQNNHLQNSINPQYQKLQKYYKIYSQNLYQQHLMDIQEKQLQKQIKFINTQVLFKDTLVYDVQKSAKNFATRKKNTAESMNIQIKDQLFSLEKNIFDYQMKILKQKMEKFEIKQSYNDFHPKIEKILEQQKKRLQFLNKIMILEFENNKNEHQQLQSQKNLLLNFHQYLQNLNQVSLKSQKLQSENLIQKDTVDEKQYFLQSLSKITGNPFKNRQKNNIIFKEDIQNSIKNIKSSENHQKQNQNQNQSENPQTAFKNVLNFLENYSDIQQNQAKQQENSEQNTNIEAKLTELQENMDNLGETLKKSKIEIEEGFQQDQESTKQLGYNPKQIWTILLLDHATFNMYV